MLLRLHHSIPSTHTQGISQFKKIGSAMAAQFQKSQLCKGKEEVKTLMQATEYATMYHAITTIIDRKAEGWVGG